MKSTEKINSKLKRLSILLSMATILFTTSFVSSVSAASQTAPMVIRPANSTELTFLATTLAPVILGQTGSPVNAGFTETSQTVHTGRAWVAEAQVNLPECVASVNASITGSHTLTHVANSATLTTPGDEPEAGMYLVDANNTPLATPVGATDFAIGATLVGNFGSFATTRDVVNGGVRILVYAETRDDVSQSGVQSSYTYTGIPQLEIEYDNSACPVVAEVPGVPNAGEHNSSKIAVSAAIISSVMLLMFGIVVSFKKRQFTK